MSLCLLVLSACSPSSKILLTDTVKSPIPPSLTTPVKVPRLRGNSNRDLLMWGIESEKELKRCNEQLKRITQCTADN